MATISDVAELAGVSKATVSRVIRGKTRVSDTIASRVRKAMEALHFQPNALAQALATSRSGGIGMVINELSSPYYGLLMCGVERAIEPRGMHLVVASTHADGERERDAVEFLGQRRCDGLVLHTNALSDTELVEICAHSLPLVIVNRRVPGLEACCVYSDDRLGARLATQHLIDVGHRRIACITGPLHLHQSRQRLSGYQAVLRRAGLPMDRSLVVESTFTVEGGYASALALLRDVKDVTAIFSQNDQMALGVFNACNDLGLDVPEDISVVGFDDIDWARYLHPRLSTVRQHVEEMGFAAGSLLMGKLLQNDADRPTSKAGHRLQPSLVVRDSVRRLT
jgi:LacI family transcriptional regulator